MGRAKLSKSLMQFSVDGMELHDIVQEAVTKTIPKKNKCKKAKWLSDKALQIAEKRREIKAKEKKKNIPI